MSKICIYHGNCADGFTAAWVVRKALGDSVQFFAGVYGDAPPDVKGKDVIFADFSYKRPVIEKLISEANSVLILDHHASADIDLKDIVGAEVHFDMNKSGASLTWDYFFPNEPRPVLINHVEDRDLWKFKLVGTREISATIFSYEYTFENWDMLINSNINDLIQEGKAIERKHFKDVHELIKVTKRYMNIGGYYVPVVNLPYTMSSDSGNILSKEAPFAASYYDTENHRVFGLRSCETGLDVSKIAAMYGGGGHVHASGFRVDKNHELAKI